MRQEERDRVMFDAHKAPTGGHFGFTKTLQKLRGRAWWPSIRRDVAAYVSLCGICQRCKTQPKIPADVEPLPISSAFERLHLDLMGPFPASGSEQFRYIFTAKDAATKYVVLRALKSKEAAEVTGVLFQSIFLVFGFPKTVVSDQGTEFVNKLNEAVFSRLGMEHRPTAPYHPASNGQVERCHREVNVMLRALCEPDQNNWAAMLPFVEFALNTAPTSTTLLTPFYLTFGKHPYTMLDIRLDLPFPSGAPLQSYLGNLIRARELAAQRDGRARRVSPVTRPKRAEALKVGDLVLVRFCGTGEGLSSKLSPIYQGPFRVVSVRSGNTAVLANVRNERDRIERHFDRLIKFRGQPEAVEGADEWEISQILDEASDGGQTFFLVRWRGFPPGSDSWVHEADLTADELLRQWRVDHPAVVTPPPTAAPRKRGRTRKTKRSKEPRTIERVVAHKGTSLQDMLFQVAVGQDCGPDDYEGVRQEQVANPEMLVSYLESIDETGRQAGEV